MHTELKVTAQTRLMPNSSTITLLQLIQEVAYCDGSMSREEEQLIEAAVENYGLREDHETLMNRLVENYSTTCIPSSVARGSTQRVERDVLLRRVGRFASQEEKDLAIKLAYLTASVSKNTTDADKINNDERKIYQQLLEVIQYPEERIQIIEEAARKELEEWSRPSLKELLLSWLGTLKSES